MVVPFDLRTILQCLDYSVLNVFKKILFFGEISNKLPNDLFGTDVYKTLKSC